MSQDLNTDLTAAPVDKDGLNGAAFLASVEQADSIAISNELSSEHFNGESSLHSTRSTEQPVTSSINYSEKFIFSADTNIPSLELATEMAALFREGFKGEYPNPRLLNPTQIQEDIISGKYTFAALVDTEGKLLGIGGIGHFNWLGEEVEGYGKLREFGKLIVSERAQGQGLASVLTEMRLQLLREIGVESAVSLALTSRDRSQRSLTRAGFNSSGITIRDWPAVSNPEQRESSAIMHLIMDPLIRESRDVYVPPALYRVCEIAYNSLQCERVVHVGHDSNPSAHVQTLPLTPPSIHHDVHSDSVQIFLSDTRSVRQVIEVGHGHVAAGIKHLSVTFDLGLPSAAQAAQELLDDGYVFCAVHPFSKGDLLTLQKILDLPEDFASHIKLHNDASVRVMNEIKKQLDDSKPTLH